MAEYIDLDDLTTGHAGTIGDPYSYEDYLTYRTTMASGIQFYVKGSLSTSNATNPDLGALAKHAFWDKWGDDPWRLELTDPTLKRMYNYFLSNGIIYRTAGTFAVGCSSLLSGNLVNLIVNTGSFSIEIGGGANTPYKGCSFKSSVNSSVVETPVAEDCTFDIPDFIELKGYTLTSDHCSFIGASPAGTHTNAQFNWPAGVSWPVFDAYQTLFASDLLGATLAAPAQPGIPPYAGYETDMWGSTRTGISGFSFGVPSVNFFSEDSAVDGASVTSYINKAALVNKIQSVSSDTYFDSTDELGKVYIYYTHEDLRQIKRIQHNIDGTNLSGNVTWYPGARDGLWLKTRVKTKDQNGAVVELDRSDIGTEEDATHSAGSIYLNNTSPPTPPSEGSVVAEHLLRMLSTNMLGRYTSLPE